LLVSGPEQLDDTIWRPVVLAFLRDIKANPDEDTPRLILADWLEEHGDAVRAARGEFLRLQCLAPRTPDPERETALLRQFEREWLGPLAPLARSWSWQRGLLHLEIYAEILLDDSAGLVQSEAFGWVEGVSFRQLDATSVARLAESPWLGWLNTLDLGFNHIGDAGVETLASSPNLTNLRSLWLRRNSVGDAGATALAQSKGLSNLDVLSLIDNQIGHAGARALSVSPHLDHLKLLNLEGNPIGSAAVAGLKKIARAHPRLWLHIGRRWH
jgi:uncharacterized protein (TIGR02996 family)